MSLVVVFAAALLTHTLRSLQTVDLGFKPDRVIALNVDPAASGYSNADVSRILDEILERARTVPGVKAASLAASTPHGSTSISMSVDVAGYTPKGSGDNVADFNFVSADYFTTLGQRLLRGRDFNARDDQNGPRVAIVNQKFARKFFGGQDAIGRKFEQGGGAVEIAGVVQDARDRTIRGAPEPSVYIPEKQGQTSGLTLLVRSEYEPARIIPSLLAIVKSVDPRLPVFSVHTLDAELEAGLSSERILGYLSTLFAALAILLVGIGLYGVLAYSVVRRTREIGVRLAVGAQQRDVAGLFARESFVLVMLGLGIGGPVAIESARALGSLLFGIAATDLSTLALSACVLVTAALLATAIPLRRAVRVDAVIALRYQ